MTIDRSELMKAAWVIIRRFQGNGEPLNALKSRALSYAWYQANQKQRVALQLSAEMAERQRQTDRPIADLMAAIIDLENRNYLSPEQRDRLSVLQRALAEKFAAEQAAKRKLIESARGRICAVTFTKKDGSTRLMKVQPAKLKFHVKGDAASVAARRAGETRAERHPHLMPVWDVEKAAPRFVNLATVSRITVDGQTHTYA